MFIHLLSLGAYQPDGGKKVSTEFQLPESSVNYLKNLLIKQTGHGRSFCVSYWILSASNHRVFFRATVLQLVTDLTQGVQEKNRCLDEQTNLAIEPQPLAN